MKKVFLLIKTALIATVACILMLHTDIAKNAVQKGILLCTGSVLPILFPFFVLSDLWIRCGVASRIAVLSAPFMEYIFHLPGSSSSAFLLGSMGGYPVGAKTVSQLYQTGIISKNEAEQALMFCNNAGPSFIIGIVGFGVLQSMEAGLLLYVIHVLSSIIIGILFRPSKYQHKVSNIKHYEEPFLPSCKAAIYEGGRTAIIVCIYILFFSIISGCLMQFLPVSTSSSVIIHGLLEMTSGFHNLKSAPLPSRTVFSISALLLGFGGCCVLLQTVSFTEAAGLSCRKMLIGNVIQGILGACFAYILWPILPTANPCFRYSSSTGSLSQFWLLLLLWLILLGILKKTSGKKVRGHI